MRHREAKYIVLRDMGESIFIFGQHEVHRSVAERLTGGNLSRVIAAGFCMIDDTGYHCYGHSESIGVMSRGREDEYLLEELFGEERW